LTDLNNNNPIEGVSITIVGDNLTNWNATMIGPIDTPYEGGKFIVNIDFSDNYPFKAPKVHFKTKIFHPNIKQDTGEICAQAIENNWVPTLNARFVIESLVTLLKNPNADHPLEAEIAEIFSKDYKGFCTKAREFTSNYAK
jgi:ubiquitin-conjugating enzyme E2 D/E